MRNPLTFAESGTTTYLRSLQNPQQNQCDDKIYAGGICTRIPLKFCKWNPLPFWNIIKDLSLESRNMQTQNCAPIQCTVWPRSAFSTKNSKSYISYQTKEKSTNSSFLPQDFQKGSTTRQGKYLIAEAEHVQTRLKLI